MTRLQGLPPIVGAGARVLILGSFPSETSLRQQQYYAHPRNQLWSIIEQLFGIARSKPYSQRCQQLAAHNIAVWDVIETCRRQGSLDSKIRDPEANDFAAFYRKQPQIVAVFWNGAAAERHYHSLVGMALKPVGCDALAGVRLPSSSPAHASVSLPDKIAHWQVLRDTLAGTA